MEIAGTGIYGSFADVLEAGIPKVNFWNKIWFQNNANTP